MQRAADPNFVPVTIGMKMLTPRTGSWIIVSFQSICNIMRMINSNNKIFRQTVNKWHILVRIKIIGLRKGRYKLVQMQFQMSGNAKAGHWPSGFGFCSEDCLSQMKRFTKSITVTIK